MEAIAEGDWSSLSGMYTNEEADFMAQLLNNCPLPDENASNLAFSSGFWPSNHSTMAASFCFSDIANNSSSPCSFSQGSSGSILFPCSSSQESYYLSDSHPIFVANENSPISMDFCMEDATNNTTSSYLVEADHDHCLNQEMGNAEQSQTVKTQNLEPKRESEIPKPEVPIAAADNKITSNLSETSKKRSRSSGDVQKSTRKNARSKKNQISVSTTNNNNDIEDGGNGGLNGQTSASCSSEDESNASQDLNGGVSSSSKGQSALNSNGKTRASRGAATDPQSLYARKRRERINERLRILQNLVPNGTKVDISTMLEEAVEYVKFLQLQIKLLSSDDLWMYAPIAYNGMNIGLDLKVGATPKRS
ncbi:hypothetical protein COLO4_32525 [Corchorus olitorius]|uniref:BHLH domain-containing protein n=1 Tax=Corchorus olitorius TaxID=93759 RepID=A0A1R3GZ07_9ROSI|nr:hypothetical protein COLO4_32525 [Corchorus olitorius]